MWHSFRLLGDSHIKTSLAHDNQAKETISGLNCGPMQSLQTRQANRQYKQISWLQKQCSCVVLLVVHMWQVAKFALFTYTSSYLPLPISANFWPSFGAGDKWPCTEWQQLGNLLRSSVLLRHKLPAVLCNFLLHNGQWQPAFPSIIRQWLWVLSRMLITTFFKAVAKPTFHCWRVNHYSACWV